jgi:hypothetical protein
MAVTVKSIVLGRRFVSLLILLTGMTETNCAYQTDWRIKKNKIIKAAI